MNKLRCLVQIAALLVGVAGLLAGAHARADEAWDQVVAAAKQEGEVIVWGESGESRRVFWKDDFEKANTGIRVDLFQASRSADRDSRYQREREAGVASLDIIVGGSAGALARLRPLGLLQPIRPFMRPEILDPKVWSLGEPLWMDYDKKYMLVSDYQAVIPLALNYNVGEKDIQSWEDLLDPKYDGKIVMLDPRSSGEGFAMGLFIYYNDHLGPDYFSRLYAHGRIVFSPDEQQNVEWIDSGRMLLGIGPNPMQMDALHKLGGKLRPIPVLTAKGQPVASVLSSDGILFLPNLGDNKPLPHPNAAKVYINWFYSQAGQQAMVNAIKNASYRNDVDMSKDSPLMIRRPGVDYVNMNDERFMVGDTAKKMRDAVTAAVSAK